MSNLVGLGGIPQPRDSKKGNSRYCACGISAGEGKWGRMGNGTRDKDTDRYDSAAETETGKGRISFTERNGMRSNWVNWMKEEGSG